MGETLSVWEECYERRLAWAYKAKGDFINSIDNETFRSLYNQNSNKTVNIAVYGQSQVGKTTLILKLIGIKEEHYEEVSSILRADIPKGKSVTPTSIIYLKSKDNHFYYKEGDNECRVNKNELKEKLKDLRIRVETNIEINSLEELQSNVLIKIPLIYFEEKNILEINIIDLPGYGSANDKEQRHVKKVIESISPILNLVLIVSNKITDLVKSNKPSRNYWYILTRSVSSDSVKKRFDNNSIKDKDEYVKFVKSEFGKDLKDDDEVYPLEYGDSWSVLDKNTKDKAEGIINELFDDLRKNISDSSTEYNQLMQNAKHYKYIEKMICFEMAEYNKEIEAKEIELSHINSNLENVITLNKYCIKENEQLALKFLNVSYDFNYTQPKFFADITVSNLELYLKKFGNNICEKAHQEWKKQKDRYPEVDFLPSLNVITISNNEAAVMRSKLKGYLFDWYSPLTDNAENDKRKCEVVVKEIYNKIKNKIETTFKNEVEKYNTEIEVKISKNARSIANYQHRITIYRALIKNVEKEIEEKEIKKRQFAEDSYKDLETAKKFKEHLIIEFLKERNRTTDILNNIQTPKEMKFFNFLYLSLISSECEKLINQPI